MPKTYGMRKRIKINGRVYTAHVTAAWYPNKASAQKDAKSLRSNYSVRVVKNIPAPGGYYLYTSAKQ